MIVKSRINFTGEFKMSILQEIEATTAFVVCKEHELTDTLVIRRERLKKGIASITKQIGLHKDNLKKAEHEDELELVEYYR
jgi:hypothetical protein